MRTIEFRRFATLRSATLIAAFAMTALTAGSAIADTLIMATDRAGTLYNATGSGLATVATKYSKHRVIVRAFSGPDAYISALNSGEYALSAISSTTAYFNFHGKNKAKKSTKDLRLLRSGSGALRLGFVVYDDSEIDTIADLKGKRVTSEFGGHTVIGPMVTAALETAGLTWNDVKPVPVTGALEAPRSLGAERVDASWASLGMPVVREIHAKRKVRYLSFENTPKTEALLRQKVFPGIRLVTLPPIKHLGLTKPTTLISTDSYLVTHKDADPAWIKDILKALWDHTAELRKAHFSLQGFEHKFAATDLPMIPYHPTAIDFYKEKGVWSPEVAAANEAVR